MKTQVFISYRRNTGLYLAKSVADCLRKQGYNVFFDYSSMRNGEFNTQIFSAIETADDFIFIWSEQSLENCSNLEDWVRQEILYARSLNKHIIVIKDESSLHSTEIVQSELQFLKKCYCFNITLDTFRNTITNLCKVLKAHPMSKLSSVLGKKYKLILVTILILLGLTITYLSIPISTKEIDEKYNELTLRVPKDYIDLSEYIDDIETDFFYLVEPDIVFADKKNFNEIIGFIADSEYLDIESMFEDVEPELVFEIFNQLQDKSILEKEQLSIQEYAQCMKAFFSLIPMVKDLDVYVEKIENEQVCFVEYSIKEKYKFFTYKMGVFFKPDNIIENELTSYMVVAGCSESVNMIRCNKVFNTMNYIIKKMLQDKTFAK